MQSIKADDTAPVLCLWQAEGPETLLDLHVLTHSLPSLRRKPSTQHHAFCWTAMHACDFHHMSSSASAALSTTSSSSCSIIKREALKELTYLSARLPVRLFFSP